MDSQTTSEFDRLLPAVDGVFDALFAKSFFYRRKQTGAVLSIVASLGSHLIEAKIEEGTMLYDSWHGHRFDVASSQLVDGAIAFVPEPGDEIAEPNADGSSQVYLVTKTTKGRCYDPIDAEERRLLVFTKQIRVEAAA
jgi:hypothetical protein